MTTFLRRDRSPAHIPEADEAKRTRRLNNAMTAGGAHRRERHLPRT
jgi:hypothetical protein